MNLDLIRCGVIGVGYFGKHYVRLLQKIEGMRLRVVADNSAGALVAIPASVKKTTKWQEVMTDPGIDCIIIATPVSQHFSLAKTALEAGKHVLVEKPMTSNLKEAYELQKLVDERKKVFLVGHQYLYNDYIEHLKKEIENGTLGKIRYIFTEHFYFGPIRYDVGCFWETATHQLAIIDYLFRPEQIVEAQGKSVDFTGTGRDDFSAAEVLFSDGILASIVVSWFSPEKVRRFTIAGDKGVAVFDDTREEKLKLIYHPYPLMPAGSSLTSYHFKSEEAQIYIPSIHAKEPLQNQLEHLQSCIRDGISPRTGIEHGVRVIQFLERISRAIKKI